jgi:hypothetical protein
VKGLWESIAAHIPLMEELLEIDDITQQLRGEDGFGNREYSHEVL